MGGIGGCVRQVGCIRGRICHVGSEVGGIGGCVRHVGPVIGCVGGCVRHVGPEERGIGQSVSHVGSVIGCIGGCVRRVGPEERGIGRSVSHVGSVERRVAGGDGEVVGPVDGDVESRRGGVAAVKHRRGQVGTVQGNRESGVRDIASVKCRVAGRVRHVAPEEGGVAIRQDVARRHRSIHGEVSVHDRVDQVVDRDGSEQCVAGRVSDVGSEVGRVAGAVSEVAPEERRIARCGQRGGHDHDVFRKSHGAQHGQVARGGGRARQDGVASNEEGPGQVKRGQRIGRGYSDPGISHAHELVGPGKKGVMSSVGLH